MKIRPVFAWYELWIGMYWDRKSRRLYILPVPCLGIYLEFEIRPRRIYPLNGKPGTLHGSQMSFGPECATVLMKAGEPIHFGDVVYRLQDGKLYRTPREGEK